MAHRTPPHRQTETSIAEGQRYLESASDLRNSIYFNFLDDKFANVEHGTIRYLFDSNVVRFFLNPMADLDHVCMFRMDNHASLSALAITTAEFLLSRELCGQWGAPAMISSAHAHELESRANELVNAGYSEPPLTEIEEALRAEIAKAIRMAATPGALGTSVDLLLEMEPLVRKLVSNEGYEARMFSRLGLENLMEPMHLNEFSTSDVLHPPARDIDDWTKLIEAHQRVASKNDKTGGTSPGGRRDRNNRADAITATQLVMLNEAALGDARHRNIRFVIVTLDRAYYNAAVEWYENEGRKRLAFFPFRRISQYIPYLNINQMPNNVSGTRLLEELSEALDNLPNLSRRKSDGFPRMLPVHGGPNMFSGSGQMSQALSIVANKMSDGARTHRPGAALKDLWGRLSRNSVFMNAAMIRRRLGAFSGLADFLESSADIRQALVDYMEQTIDEVERAHIAFSIQTHLDAKVRAAAGAKHDQRSASRRGTAVRGMMLLRRGFDRFTDGIPLYRYLNQTVNSDNAAVFDRLYEKLAKVQDYTAYFFSGCVAFWAGAWDSANRFADLALQRFDRDQEGSGADPRERAELQYFRAVTKRYVALNCEDDLRQTEGLLRKTLSLLKETAFIGNETDDLFLTTRAKIEIALTRISLSYAIVLADEGRLEESKSEMRQALDLFGECEPSRGDMAAKIDRDLMIQFEAELLIGATGCLLQRFFFERRRDDAELERWHGILDEIQHLLGKDIDMVPALYSVAVDLLAIVYCANPLELPERVKAAQRQMRALAHPDRQDTTWLDRHALTQLASRLEEASRNWMFSPLDTT